MFSPPYHRIKIILVINFIDYNNDCFLTAGYIVSFPMSFNRYSRRVRSKMTLRRLRTSMFKARSKSYPRIPESLTDLTRTLLQNPRVSVTCDGSENLYAGSVTATDGSHHVAFFSPRMLEFMGNLRVIQGDGTFRARPAVPRSSQCFVLVTTWNNCVC